MNNDTYAGSAENSDYFPARKEACHVNKMKLVRTGFNRKLTDWNSVKEIKVKNVKNEEEKQQISSPTPNP